MPKLEDLKKLEVFCRRKECGDPVVDRNGNIVYTKRTMNLVAVSAVFDRVTFQCPVCGAKRKFGINAFTERIREI